MRVPVPVTTRTQRSNEAVAYLPEPSALATRATADAAQSAAQFGGAVAGLGDFVRKQAEQAQRFSTLQSFSAFQDNVNKTILDLKRNADPRLGNFADIANATYTNMEAKWLSTVPDSMYDEFKTRAADVGSSVANDALQFQYTSTDAYFKQGIQDASQAALERLSIDPSMENLQRQRATVDEFIGNTSLTPAEKVAQRRAAYAGLEAIAYHKAVLNDYMNKGLSGESARSTAVDLMFQNEGPTIQNNGLSYDQNVELMSQRAIAAEQIAAKAVGSLDLWAAMPTRARAALIALTDTYGELPARVVKAVKTGNLEEVARAVQAYDGDHTKVLADIIRGDTSIPEAALDLNPAFANLPYEDRLALRKDAQTQAASLQTADAKQKKAQNDAVVNKLYVDLFDGKVGQYAIDQLREQGILTDYDDINKAQEILKKNQGDLLLAQQGLAMLRQGITFDPTDTDQKKMLNALVGKPGIAALNAQDKDFAANVLVPLVRHAQDIPTDVSGLLTGMIRSNDQGKALYALDLLSQLQNASPKAFAMRTDDATAADVTLWQYGKDYYPPDELMKMIRGSYDQETRQRQVALRAQGEALFTKSGGLDIDSMTQAAVNQLGDMTNGQPTWRWGDPSINNAALAGLKSDFKELFLTEYSKDGDVAGATARATAALSRAWGVSEVGGGQQLMKYPPELVYPSWNGSYDWIGKQVRDTFKLPDGAPFTLISDSQTHSEIVQHQQGADPMPSYLVVWKDANGVAHAPETDWWGRPMRIFFETTPEMEKAKMDTIKAGQEANDKKYFMQTYNDALLHSVMTSIPVPQDLQDEYNLWNPNATP